ncbi:SPW repeat domain-containing protein [Actinacidiphila sp. bgisy160]|uniref:SPW repeat domain-containing protein n=1 Tax=Actinacidiphila sp. bgisy160 TaxID=3413796 RepID=UPI003D733A2B
MSLAQRPGTRIQTAGHTQTPPADVRDSLFTAPLLLIGGWLFAAGWALAYPDTPIGNNVRIVDLVFSTIVLLNAIARVARTRGPGSDVITIVCGACLVASPFVFGYFDDPGAGLAPLNQIVTGASLIVLGAVSLALIERRHPRPPGEAAPAR